jgi:hypothetical protein
LALLAPTDEARFVQGTYGYGYLETEYMQTSKLTSKSFSVVVLELLTCRKAMHHRVGGQPHLGVQSPRYWQILKVLPFSANTIPF